MVEPIENQDFSWSDFFKAFAKTIYDYKDRRDEFSDIMKEIAQQCYPDPVPKLPTKFSPFSAYALINRLPNVKIRVGLCEAIREHFKPQLRKIGNMLNPNFASRS